MAPPRNRRPGFSRRAQYGLFLAYVVAGLGALTGAILLVLSTINPPAFAALRSGAAELTVPVSGGLAAAGRVIMWLPNAIGRHFRVAGENAELREQLRIEHAIVMNSRSLPYDNRRLKKLLGVRERSSDTIVAARLVSSSASSTRRFAILNAGSRQGVHPGQPVRGPNGLIGRILETGPNTARVLLLGDSESLVPVRRARDGMPAVAAGRGDGMLEIRPISLSDSIFNIGDVLVSSGTGGIYPPNVPVARVIARTRDSATARPFEQPDTLDFALVQQAFFPVPRSPDATP